MFQGDWTTSSNIYNHSTLNSEHNWEDLMYLVKKSTNMHFQCLEQNQERSDLFQSGFCRCFIIHLLMQHKFHCVDVSW